MYDQASQIKSGVLSALEEGLSKGKDVVKDARALVSGRLPGAEAAAQEVDLPESDVKKALKQRYEGGPVPAKSAAEVLKERYVPLDQRDNTVLRGI